MSRIFRRWWLSLIPLAAALVLLVVWLNHSPPTKPIAPKPEVLWIFQANESGAVISSPCYFGGRVFVGAIRDAGLSPGGVVYALNANGGKIAWRFDDQGTMLHMYSSPHVADGLLYIGEGMHANFSCNLRCLDVSTGAKRWQFPIHSHLESSPYVANGQVFFGAGDDGVYAANSRTGEKVWQFNDQVHVDTSPALADGRLFVGSGVSGRVPAGCLLALSAKSGKVHWRIPTELPAWGSPVADGKQVFFGLGNGSLTQSDPNPAGAEICLDAETGQRLWLCPVPDAVFGAAAVDSNRVYFGSRNGFLYAVDRIDGRVIWKENLGSAIVTTPALRDGKLYVVASGGGVACLNAADGRRLWTFDVAAHAQSAVQLLSSPLVIDDIEAGRHRIIFGGELKLPSASAAVVYCLRD